MNQFCQCGCGQKVKPHTTYMFGHYLRGKPRQPNSGRCKGTSNNVHPNQNYRLCACGCGEHVTKPNNQYLSGHNHTGKIGGNLGKHWTMNPDCHRMVYGASDETRQILSKARKGKKLSEQQIERMRIAFRGAGNPSWRGGLSFEPYTKEFNDQMKWLIRVRDAFTCQFCGMPERENGRALSTHHIDYDKKNTFPNNLICLCDVCHPSVNKNREYWTVYFRDLLNKRQANPKALVKKRQKISVPQSNLEVNI